MSTPTPDQRELGGAGVVWSEPRPDAQRITLADVAAMRTPLVTLTSWKLFIPGAPAPQGSKRHVGNGRMVESSKAVGPWRERVALAAHESGMTMMLGAASVELQFVLPRPASTPKRRTPHAVKRPDVDKLARAVLDALTGIAFDDDSRVIELHARKRLAEIGETPGVHIEVAEVSSPLPDTALPAQE